MIEHKTISTGTKSIEDRTVIGVCCVHGVVDEGNDRSHPGSFADTKVNGRDRIRFLWQHDTRNPPIAIINYVREVPRNQLPEKIISLAPEATGGVEVSRTYLDSQRAGEVLEGLKAGAIDEMSYAYEVSSYTITEEKDKPPIRELLGLKIFDLSDVLHGMNPYTLGSKSWTGESLTFTDHSEAVVSIVKEFLERAKDRNGFRQKEGRVLSTTSRNRIIEVAEELRESLAKVEAFIKETEPKEDPAHARALFIQYQQKLAHLNGVMNYAN